MGMAFDSLCKCIDDFGDGKLGTTLQRMARGASLFVVDSNPELTSFVSMDDDEFLASTDMFFLPFPSVAVEILGRDRCLIFEDIGNNSAPGLINKKRMFAGIINVGKTPSNKTRSIVYAGNFEIKSVDKQADTLFLSVLEGSGFFMFTDGKRDPDMLAEITKDKAQVDELREVLDNEIIHSLRVFLQINLPSRFVVQSTPPKVRPIDAPKIARSHERNTFTILTPAQIKKRYESAPGNEHLKHVSPHARRRHFRRLSSDKFVNKKGQIVEVKATWVGAEEWTFAGKKYRVRLDL